MKMKQRKTVKNKNTRGMALLFTLGVLMMVLVVVMLYASKVKTEAKLASSQLENQSAKLLAQSLLPRVMITLNKSQTAQDLHIYSSGSPSQLDFDWIWKLESPGHFEFQVKPTDFTDLGNKTVPFPKYVEGTGSDPEYDEESMPTWQYIHDPATGKYVVARFAFVTVPQTLRLNPNALASHVYCRHVSDLARSKVSANCNLCKMRLGSSPSELFFREDMLSSATRKLIQHRHNNPTVLFGKFKDQDYFYWGDTQGFTDAFLDTDASDEDRADFVADAEKYLTVNTQYSLETFWSDINNDGIKDNSEFYHRFNLRRTDWNKVGVAKDEDGSAVPSGCDDNNYILAPPRPYSASHLSEIKEVSAKGDNNFPTGGIAWLNNWQDGGDWGKYGVAEAVEKTKKQIAANLINFCSPASRPVVSDVHPKDWTKTSAKPTYTGLKRTLYLNEVYFEIAANASVEVEKTSTNQDGTSDYRVKVEYFLDSRVFAELVDMYYNTLGMKISDANDTPDFSAYSVYIDGSCEIKYNKPSKDGNNLSYSSTTHTATFNTMDFVRVEDAGAAAEEYKPEEDNTRRGYYLYCNKPDSGDGFTKTVFSEEFNLENRSTPITENDVQSNIKLTDKPVVKINRVVVRRKEVTTGLMKDSLSGSESMFPAASDRDGEYENVDISLLDFNSGSESVGNPSQNLFSGSKAQTVWMRGNFQIDDPRQNLLKEDWQNANSSKDKCYTALFETIDTESGTLDYDKIRHSLPFTYTTNAATGGSGGGGGNKPGSGKPGSSRPGSGGSSGGESRSPNGVNFDYNGEGDDLPNVRYTKRDNYKNPEQDYEEAEDPAWMLSKGKGGKISKLGNVDYSDHVSTAFIRHANPNYNKIGGSLIREFPMMSPWELGAIHRGSKWQTLNIARSRQYYAEQSGTKHGQNFVDPGKEHGGAEYKYGDGPILDQIKMTNDIKVLGKIDLCEHAYDDVKNFTLGSLFLDMPLTEGNYLLQVINAQGEGDTKYPINDESVSRITPAQMEECVQELYDAIYIGMDKTLRDPGDAPKNPEAKALYDSVAGNNRFFRRSDILAFNPASGSSGLSWEPFTRLRPNPAKSGTTDAMDEQVIGRCINLMSVEQTKVKSIKALLVVQTLRDRGKVSIRKDWNNNGKTGETLNLRASNHMDAQLQAGYRRFSDAGDDGKIFATYDQLKENVNATNEGRFDPGADTIIGEAKILATLEYDQATQKWKIMRYEFVE